MFYPTHNSIYKLFSYFYSNNTETLEHEIAALQTELDETRDYAHDIMEENKQLKEKLENRLINLKTGNIRLSAQTERPYTLTYDRSDCVFNVVTDNGVSIICSHNLDTILGYVKSQNKKFKEAKSSQFLPNGK